MIAVLVSGEGTNLQALIDRGLPVACVASSRAGIPALDRAASAHIPTGVFAAADYSSREARDDAMADWLTEHGATLVVCAGYMQLLSPSFVRAFAGRIVNVHPAPLPRFPGPNAVADVLASGARWSAVTVLYVDEGVDTGEIVDSVPIPIFPGDDEGVLHARTKRAEHELLPRVVRRLLSSELATGAVATRSAELGRISR